MLRHARTSEWQDEDCSCSAAIGKSRTEEARSVERAKIVLARLEGRKIQQVAREPTIAIPTVTKQAERFSLWGLRGPRDDLRSGKPVTYGAAF